MTSRNGLGGRELHAEVALRWHESGFGSREIPEDHSLSKRE